MSDFGWGSLIRAGKFSHSGDLTFFFEGNQWWGIRVLFSVSMLLHSLVIPVTVKSG